MFDWFSWRSFRKGTHCIILEWLNERLKSPFKWLVSKSVYSRKLRSGLYVMSLLIELVYQCPKKVCRWRQFKTLASQSKQIQFTGVDLHWVDRLCSEVCVMDRLPVCKKEGVFCDRKHTYNTLLYEINANI